ncbi:MAG: hypothetical protein AAFN79_03185 [Pseudomonadota bacterium]
MARVIVFLLALMAPFAASSAELEVEHLSGEWRPFVGVSIASKHVGADRDFQEFNPGVSLGLSRRIGWRRGEWGLEGGYFQNSYDEGSFYAGLWADWPVASIEDRLDVRLGGFFGYAEYPQLVDEAEDFGALVIGDFVPLVAAQASLRIDDRFSLLTRFGPGIEDSDVILSLQAFYFF